METHLLNLNRLSLRTEVVWVVVDVGLSAGWLSSLAVVVVEEDMIIEKT